MLQGIGLSADDETVYLALLGSARQTMAELARSAQIGSRARLGRAVDTLIENGLATRFTGHPVYVAAVAPDIGLDALAQRRVESARRVNDLMPGLMEVYWTANRDPEATEVIELISGAESRDQLFLQLQRGVKREVRAFDCPPYAYPETVGEPDAVECAALAKGISYRVIYHRPTIDTHHQWPSIEAAMAAGEQSRVRDDLPVKLTLFDDTAAAVPITTATGKRIAVLVRSSSLLSALSALFESYWADAVPLTPQAQPMDTPPKQRLSDAELRLAAMLAAGLSDDAIRRNLEVSASTVQRRIRDLLRRLGAKTRFQAGLQLGRLDAPAG